MSQTAWSIKGIEREIRELAKSSAAKNNMTLGEWIDHIILEENASPAPAGTRTASNGNAAPADGSVGKTVKSAESANEFSTFLDAPPLSPESSSKPAAKKSPEPSLTPASGLADTLYSAGGASSSAPLSGSGMSELYSYEYETAGPEEKPGFLYSLIWAAFLIALVWVALFLLFAFDVNGLRQLLI